MNKTRYITACGLCTINYALLFQVSVVYLTCSKHTMHFLIFIQMLAGIVSQMLILLQFQQREDNDRRDAY